MSTRMTLAALQGIPQVQPGDDLTSIVIAALEASQEVLADGDILVVAQKIISKAEGRIVALEDVVASERAVVLAAEVGKDPRQVELVLRESREIVKHRPGVLIVEQNLGLVMANAGIDHSNIESPEGREQLLLLPLDPDASCQRLRDGLSRRLGVTVGVIVNDSIGRAWRVGTVGQAIGVAGLPAVIDLRGETDLFGRELLVSEQAVADELAAAASLLQGQGAEGLPVVLIRGFVSDAPVQGADALVRPREMDMFR
ncbi:MAG: coenzyme F420-0:L-glutamate ligase [Proteobacteria bacterium]|nr:coenzyme F420-0:L-glutamate ligase [Pseudomonadota bacterium]MDA1309211.1 coenzyme F420-0:L-glutamate ligase [Pseudomonadota bacterium]